ncbi:MAG: hypothetical protein JWO03_4091 [Bacteroidetes bacterium]|nr:hypothetical protein [Bacteroidota bacterium]
MRYYNRLEAKRRSVLLMIMTANVFAQNRFIYMRICIKPQS